MASIEVRSGPVVDVELEGDINIARAIELKGQLSKALDLERDICVSLGRVSSLDITGFQLLWAAARQAGTMGHAFTFKASLPAEIRGRLIEAGLSCASLVESES